MQKNFPAFSYSSLIRSAAVFALLMTSACGLGLDSGERLARGEAAYEEGDFRTASIDAKSVLRQEPDNVDARLLLGRASVRIDDAASAESEFRRAIDMGVPKEEVALDLGRALIMLRQYNQVLEELTPDLFADTDDRLALLNLRADAQMGLGLYGTARSVYQEVLAADPDNVDAMLGVASSHDAQGDVGRAQAAIDDVLSVDRSNITAWLVSASLALKSRNADAAEERYRTAEKLAIDQGDQNSRVTALIGIVEAELARRDQDAAVAGMQELENLAPDNIATSYLAARLAYQQGDYLAAENALRRVLNEAPGYTSAKLLMGAVQLQRGNLAQAEANVSEVLDVVPNHPEATGLFAQIRLRQGDAEDANEILQSAIASGEPDDRLVSMAVQTGLRSGNYGAAIAIIEERLTEDPDNVDIQLELAAALIAAGQIDDAEAIIDSLPEGTGEGAFLQDFLSAYATLQRGNTQAALAQATTLAEQYPDESRAQSLLSSIALQAGNVDQARAAMLRAQELVPSSLVTYLNIAGIDIARGDFDAAREQLTAALDQDPTAPTLMFAMARLEQRAGNVDTARDWFARSGEADPNAAAPRMALAQLELGQGDAAAAEAAARLAVEANGANPDAHRLLGISLQAQDDLDAAVGSFRKAAELAPEREDLRSRLAAAHAANEDFVAAENAMLGSAGLDLSNVGTAAAVAAYRARGGNLEGAMEIVDGLKAADPEGAAPHGIEAEVMANAGEFQRSAAAYDRALAIAPNDKAMVLRAYRVRRSGGMTDAARPLREFLDSNPRDVDVRVALAQSLAASGDSAGAIREYQRSLEIAPSSIPIMNNLAWEYMVAGDARAETLARRAYQQAPANVDVADTLGWILVQKGNRVEGIEILERALDQSGDSPVVKYHLAAALAESDDPERARQLLTEALSDDTSFTGRADAEALLDSL